MVVYVNWLDKKIITEKEKEGLIKKFEQENLKNKYIKKDFLHERFGNLVTLYEKLENGMDFAEIQERFKEYCKYRAENSFSVMYQRKEI